MIANVIGTPREISEEQLRRMVGIVLLNLTAIERMEGSRMPRPDRELLRLVKDLNTDFVLKDCQRRV